MWFTTESNVEVNEHKEQSSNAMFVACQFLNQAVQVTNVRPSY